MAEIFNIRDYQRKEESGWKVSEGPTDFKALEAEITAAMFASGMDTPVEVIAAFYETSMGYWPPNQTDKDPA